MSIVYIFDILAKLPMDIANNQHNLQKIGEGAQWETVDIRLILVSNGLDNQVVHNYNTPTNSMK